MSGFLINPYRFGGGLPHVTDDNARLSIDPTGKTAGYQVVQDSDGLTYTWNGPSTAAVAGVTVSGTDADDGAFAVNGSDVKNNYTGLQVASLLQWSSGHSDWELTGGDSSSDDTTYPWEATWGIATVTRNDIAAPSNWTP
jgi:hypothetical protein